MEEGRGWCVWKFEGVECNQLIATFREWWFGFGSEIGGE